MFDFYLKFYLNSLRYIPARPSTADILHHRTVPGLGEKTQFFLLGKFNKRFGNTVPSQSIMIVEVMLHNQMSVSIEYRLSSLCLVKLVARVALARLLHGGEENRVVILLRAEFIIPFLHEQNRGLCTRMGLEHVAMKSDHSQNTAFLGNEITDILIAAVVESSLWKDNSHTTAGFQHVQVALDKEDIAPDLRLLLAFGVFAQLILGHDAALLDVPCKGWIRHEHVKLIKLVAILVPTKFPQFLPTFVIDT